MLFLNQIQGWNTVRESYSCVLEQVPLPRSRKGLMYSNGSVRHRIDQINLASRRTDRIALISFLQRRRHSIFILGVAVLLRRLPQHLEVAVLMKEGGCRFRELAKKEG